MPVNCSSQGGQEFDQISYVIAISLAILAAISNNLGVNFQKLAWTKKQNNSSIRIFRFIWIAGMIGIILASVFDFVALAFGPQSVIAPLGALTMVINAVVAPKMHGEKLQRIVYVATFVIVAGCSMSVATASHENIICNLDGIYAFFLTPQTISYAIIVTVLSIVVMLLIKRCERILREHKVDSEQYQKVFKFHRISYALLAGIFGAQTVVFARALGQSVQSSARGDQLFLARPETYGILFGLLFMIYAQLLFLNKGLERFESSYNVPVFTGTFIVTTAISGGAVYDEFAAFDVVSAVLFPLGVCMCVFGVYLLARGGSAAADDESVAMNNTLGGPLSSPSLVTVDDLKGTPQFPTRLSAISSSKEKGEVRDAPSLSIPSNNASIRIRSGGFMSFAITDRTRSASTPSRNRGATEESTSHVLQHNWLLGFKIDEEEGYIREGSTPSY